jgi:LacI family transcriptional regulator
MVSMKDIANKLSLSRTTVSNILNNKLSNKSYKKETIESVFKTAREMGYIPNSLAVSLKTGSTKTIAIVVPDIANDFYVNIIKETEKLCNEVNYSLIICITEEQVEKEERALKMLQSRMVDGVLIAPVSFNKSLLETYPFKIVCFDRTVSNGRFPTVTIDNYIAAKSLTNKLLSTGARNPLFMAGSKSDYTITQRLVGHQDALKDNGLVFDNNNVIYNIFDDQDAYNKLNDYIHSKSHSFDSVFLSTNYCVYGVLKSLTENNKGNTPIGGFENFKGSELISSKVYKVEQPEKEIADLAFRKLLSLLKNEEVKDSVLKTRIIE